MGRVKDEPWLLVSQTPKHSYGRPLEALNTPDKTSVEIYVSHLPKKKAPGLQMITFCPNISLGKW